MNLYNKIKNCKTVDDMSYLLYEYFLKSFGLPSLEMMTDIDSDVVLKLLSFYLLIDDSENIKNVKDQLDLYFEDMLENPLK